MKFTKGSIADNVLEVSYSTFNNYIKSDKIFKPHINNHPGSRPYYDLTDAMLMSYIIHGTIKMELITKLLKAQGLIKNSLADSVQCQNQVKNSFQLVKSYITKEVNPPIDLDKYLQYNVTDG